jgi:hypothetical protein
MEEPTPTQFIRYSHYSEAVIDGRWVFEYGIEDVEGE